ncbi:MAG TPA: sugar phosphate isomerase/epimerase [Pyrinomonadaceae bacterium]|nr:sugar phosphate isomerase/epimerase [Pyrinomonadaceae bacterium]
MNRRSFLGAALCGAFAASRPAGPGHALAPHDRRRLSRVGLQLYTVRAELAADFEGTLARVAALGFREVEFAGYHGRAPSEIRAALRRHGLLAPSAHVTTAGLRDGLGSAVEAALVLGHRYLVCGYVPEEERRSLDDYRRLAELLDRAGERTRRAGLQLCYHNHDFEFEAVGGQAPYDLLLARADARLVKMQLDLYWIAKAGRSPLEYFSKHAGRFPSLHVKDMDATPRRSFTEVGRGVIDFKAVFAAAARAGVRHYFVEQDETPGSPFESARVSLDYLRRLRF